MVTSSLEEAQKPLLIVHLNTLLDPTVKPVTPLVALPVLVTEALPEVTVQTPVPTVGLLADKVATVTLHKLWSVPALEVVGNALTVTVISSVDELQEPLLIVHLNTVLPPTVKPVTPLLGSLEVLADPLPLTVLHAPVPTVGVLADKVPVVTLHRP